MLGQRSLGRQTCGTSRAAGSQRFVVSNAFKRNKNQGNVSAPNYPLPPLDGGNRPQQQQPAQPQQGNGYYAPPGQMQPAQRQGPPMQQGQQGNNMQRPQRSGQQGYQNPPPPQQPAQPAFQNPAQAPGQTGPGFVNPGPAQPGFMPNPAAAPAAAPQAPSPQPPINPYEGSGPQQQGPPQGMPQNPAQGYQQGMPQNPAAGVQQTGGFLQPLPQQQQGTGYAQPQGQPNNAAGYYAAGPNTQQGYQQGYQQAGGYQQQPQQPAPQQVQSWADVGGYMDQGGYIDDQGGYLDQGRINPANVGGYMTSPPGQRSGWGQGGNNQGYYKQNRNQQQQQQQRYDYNEQGGYLDSSWGAPRNGRQNFAGFVDTSPGAWTEDYLLQQLDARMPQNMQLDGWVEEVEEEEDLTPKYVNGKRVLVNSEIEAPQVRVQDASKTELGVMSFEKARELAISQDADVVLINESGDPPVVRLVAFSKYKYELEKSAKQKQKASKGPEIKEVKLRPVTEKADYDTKIRQAQKFLSKGAKVKLTMTFSGREMRFKDQGKEMMLQLIEELSSVSKMEAPLALRPSNFSVTLVPLK